MKVLQDIAEAKRAATAALEAAADLDKRAAALADLIAKAPPPHTYQVEVRGQTRRVSESDALALLAGFIAVINQEAELVRVPLDGEITEMMAGDIEMMAAQILKAAAGDET
jgi:hypothetical protein